MSDITDLHATIRDLPWPEQLRLAADLLDAGDATLLTVRRVLDRLSGEIAVKVFADAQESKRAKRENVDVMFIDVVTAMVRRDADRQEHQGRPTSRHKSALGLLQELRAEAMKNSEEAR